MTNEETRPAGETSVRSRRGLVAGLGIGVVALLGLVNWLGSSAVPVSQEQFAKLMDAGLITGLRVMPGGVEARLARSVRVRAEGREALTNEVYLQLSAAPSEHDLAGWRGHGIAVTHADPGEARLHEVGGALLVALLLAIALWHLWSQVQEDRHRGSPRRRLRELEESLAAGAISPEEYQRRAQAIWMEM